MTEQPETQPLGLLLDDVVKAAEHENVQVGQIVEALGLRSYGPLLVLTTLVEMIPPLSAVPGLYIVSASVIILLCGQICLFRTQPWLPARVRKLSVSRDRLVNWLEKGRPWAKRIDKLLARRLTFFLQPPFLQCIAGLSIVMALLFFPLAFIPSSERLLAAPVLCFGLALTADDGLLALIAVLFTAAIMSLPFVFWNQIAGLLPTGFF